MARVSFISLLGALFDRLQGQAADELSKRLNELVPTSAREKGKRTPLAKTADSADGATLFAGFPRQCGFYDPTLAVLLKIEPDCGESIIKVLLMWQPRLYLDQNGLFSKNATVGGETGSWLKGSPLRKGFNFAAFTALIDPLRHLDQSWTEFIAACVEVIIAEYLRHVLLRHHGDLSSTLLEKLNESFLYYTKPGSMKYSGPEAATFMRLKAESNTAWLAIYASISARLPIEELALMRATTPDELLRYRMISMERVSDLMHAVQFMERIAAAINATKKTKLLQAYMLCLDRVTSSIDAKHKGWAAVAVRVAALYKRVLKWCKNDSLQSAANPLAAVLLLRSSPAPDELLFFVAKRTKALQSDHVDTSLRTLLALLRGNTRELEFPIENAQKSDYKRLPYGRAPLAGFANASVALGMMLEAVFGRNCRNQLANSPVLMDLAVELLLQVAAHDAKLFLYQVHRQLEVPSIEHSDLLLILRALCRMADPASAYWKAAASLSHASKADIAQLTKSLQTSLMAALSRVFSLASVNHNTNTAFAPQPVLCVPDLRLLPHDSNGVPLTHAAARAFQRCEARLARTEPSPNKTSDVLELLRDMSSAMCMPLSSVHIQLASLEDSLKRAALRSVSTAGIGIRDRSKSTVSVAVKRAKGEKHIQSELLRDALRALPLLGTAAALGDCVVPHLFHPDDEIAQTCALAVQRLLLHSPADRTPFMRRLVTFIRRLSAEHDAQLLQSAVSHLLALVDVCLVAPYLDPHAAPRARRKMTLFDIPELCTDSSVAPEVEALALFCLCHPLSAVRGDALALLDAIGHAYPPAPAAAVSPTSRKAAASSPAACPSSQPSPAMLLAYPTHVAAQALAALLSEAWPCNEHPLPQLGSCSLTLCDLAHADAPLLWVHVLRRLAVLVAESRALTALRSHLIDATQQLFVEADGSDRSQQSTFGLLLRANLSTLTLALPQDGTPPAFDATARCASGALASLGAESETGLLDIYCAVLGGAHPDCVSQLLHSVSVWHSTDFARFGQKRKMRARQVLAGAFRRLVCSSHFATALQRSREQLPFLVSFATSDEATRPATWDALQQLCEVTALVAALAAAYAVPLCEFATGALRVQLKASVANDKSWPAEQRCKLLKVLHSSANALQDSAVVNGLVEKAEAQRREQKDSKAKAMARRQVDAALVRVQMAAWRAAEAVLRLGCLGTPSKVEEVCDEQFMAWCLAGERSGVPILRWLLAHHWQQFFARFVDRCYVPADTAPLFVRALLEQYASSDVTTLSDEQRRALEAVPLSTDDVAFAKRTSESVAQLLAVLLQETGAAEVDIRTRALSVIARLATTQLGKSDGAAAPEVAQLMRTYSTALASPHMMTWRTAARRVLTAVATSIAPAVAGPLLHEVIARWRHVSSAKREWLLESLLPYASAVRIASFANPSDFLRRLMGETVLSAPLPLSPALSSLWLALLTVPDNSAHVCSFLISCGSEARHLCEASRALLVDLYCSAPEIVAPRLTERLTCESVLHMLSQSNGTEVQDAFVQREVVCDILVEVATAAPAALSLYLPVLIAYALPRVDSAKCVAARRLLGCVCQVSLAASVEQKQEGALRSFGAKLVDAKNPLELWWESEGSLLEPAMVHADVLAPSPADNNLPVRPSCVRAVEVLGAMMSVLTPLQLDALGTQLLGWSLRYQDLPLALRTQELFLAVLRPLDVPTIDSHLCALQETLGELERMPQPTVQPKPTDLLFAQRRTKALLVLRALQAAVQVTTSAEVLNKLFWCVAAVLDVPSLPYVPLLSGLLPLLTSIIRHPAWRAAEQQACVTLGCMGADFEGLVWPVLKALCGVRTEHCAFTLLCTLLELQVKSELLLRPSSSVSHLSIALAMLPWLACAMTRSASSPTLRLFGRALSSHKSAAELSQLCGSQVKADGLFKAALAVMPLSATLFDEAAPLLARLGAYASPQLQASVSRLGRALLAHQRAGPLYLDAAHHVLRVAVVNTSPAAFEALVPVYVRALRMYTKDRDETSPSDALPLNFNLPHPLAEQSAQSRSFVLSGRLTRLIEATPALAAQANAHHNLTMRQRNAAKSVLNVAADRSLFELRRMAAQYNDAAPMEPAVVDPGAEDLRKSNDSIETATSTSSAARKLSLGASESMVKLVQEANEVVLDDTREPDEEEPEGDDVGAKDDADADDLDALIRAAEKSFKGFDMCALAEATAALASMTGSATSLHTA